MTRDTRYGLIIIGIIVVFAALILTYALLTYHPVTPTTRQPLPATSPVPTLASPTVTLEVKEVVGGGEGVKNVSAKPPVQKWPPSLPVTIQVPPGSDIQTEIIRATETEINFQRLTRGLRRVFFWPEQVRGFAVPKSVMAVEEPIGTLPDKDQCGKDVHLQCVVPQGDVQLRLLQCLKPVECEVCLNHQKQEVEPGCWEAKRRTVQ